MDWTEIAIYTTREGMEHLCARLTAIGFASWLAEEENDLEELINSQQKYWDYIDEELASGRRGLNRVKIYVRSGEAQDAAALVREGMDALRADLPEVDFGSLSIEIQGRNEEEWASAWKQYYKPTPIGKSLLIVPEWETDYDAGGRTVFLNNPGMSFGTGSHASTRLCIEALEERIKPGVSLLDLGCGSGILFIIGLLLGAKDAIAVDIDPNAVNIAMRNAELNGVDLSRVSGLSGDLLEDEKLLESVSRKRYGMIFANIVADVIMPLCPLVWRLLDAGGVFIASGIIAERAGEVEAAVLSAGMKVLEIQESDGWCRIVAE